VIISASYRTDIPAFYSAWFRNRFRAGWAQVTSPYGGPPSKVALRGGVDGFVFWTRNAGPFGAALDEVRAAGLPFVVQFTLTGYPRRLERAAIEATRAIEQIQALAGRHGRRAVVWRYDPILIADETPAAWHEDNFAALAERLAGAVDEVVVSFTTYYTKTRRNLAQAGASGWRAPDSASRRAMAGRLAVIAGRHGLRLSVCSQPDGLADGVGAARCVDANRLSDVAEFWGTPRPIRARPKGNRPGCGCFESRDIGAYDTCLHGCAYCYAVTSTAAARRQNAAHDPDSPTLIPHDDPPAAAADPPRLL
jgi:hypothetical protein